jgi:hypothetical protein
VYPPSFASGQAINSLRQRALGVVWGPLLSKLVPTFPVVDIYWERRNILIIGLVPSVLRVPSRSKDFWIFSPSSVPATDIERRTLGTLIVCCIRTGNKPGTTLRTLGTFIARSFDSATPIGLPGAPDTVPSRAPGSSAPPGSYPPVSTTPVACRDSA